MTLSKSIKAFVPRGESKYMAECMEIAVVTEGETLDETIRNPQETLGLHLEGESPADFGLTPNPSLLVIGVAWARNRLNARRAAVQAEGPVPLRL